AEQTRRKARAGGCAAKPVVVSMGSVAASGGYWVSMDADEIWAHDSTVTGSIGIFGLVAPVGKPLEELGLHAHGGGNPPRAGSARTDRPLTREIAAILQAEVDYGYKKFVDGVAAGRDMPPAE